MTRLNQWAAISMATTALTLFAAPAMAQSHSQDWHPHYKTVTAVTPTTLTMKDGTATEQIPMAGLKVRAGMYPVTRGILRAGEHISVWHPAGASPIVVVHATAHGTLVQKGSLWELTTKHQGTISLAGKPIVLGASSLSTGMKAAAFGPKSGQRVDVAAVAQRPVMTEATLVKAGGGVWIAKSDQYGTLQYALTDLPPALQKRLSTMKPGTLMVACLNPQNHAVLMMMPDRHARWAKTLEHGTAGQVIAISQKDITLTNALGTVTIPLNRPVKVRWPGHPHASISQVKPGTRVLALRHEDGSLKLLVMPKSS